MAFKSNLKDIIAQFEGLAAQEESSLVGSVIGGLVSGLKKGASRRNAAPTPASPIVADSQAAPTVPTNPALPANLDWIPPAMQDYITPILNSSPPIIPPPVQPLVQQVTQPARIVPAAKPRVVKGCRIDPNTGRKL